MKSHTTTILVSAVLAALVTSAKCQKVCSVDNPKPNQVCISVKLPWQLDPVFFCTELGKINYTPQCNDPSQTHHCFDDGRNDTLKIATPWDCCPLISTPNRCANAQCPPAPYNRRCKEIKILGACCPTYYCDAGEPDNCKSSRLKSSCLTAPADKRNCTIFRDPFGCCNKYQCKSEEKPGSCPRMRHHHHHHHHHHIQQQQVHHNHVHGQAQVAGGAATRSPGGASAEHPHHHHHQTQQQQVHHNNIDGQAQATGRTVNHSADGVPATHPHHHHHHHHHHRSEEDSFDTQAVVKRIAHGAMKEAKRAVQKVAVGVKTTLENHGGPVGRYIAGALPAWFNPATTMSPYVSAAPLHVAHRHVVSQHVPGPVHYRMNAGKRMAVYGGAAVFSGGFVGAGMYPHPPMIMNPNNLMRCIGDHTCPGTMKCCSGISIYAARYNALHASSVNPVRLYNPFIRVPHFDQNGHHLPIDGFCIEPETEQESTTAAHTSTPRTNPDAETIAPIKPIEFDIATQGGTSVAPMRPVSQETTAKADSKREPLDAALKNENPQSESLQAIKSAPIVHETQAVKRAPIANETPSSRKEAAPVAVDSGDVYIRA